MVHIASGAPFFRVPDSNKRKLSRLGVASFLATSVLAAAPVAQARITQIQILTRGTAFGGHSFAGVGQYEFITGIATGEVNPNNPQNSLITDIQLAPKNAQVNVVYQHNFYILQPLDPSKGNRKMMYEPPNRGGKTYQTLNNTPSRHQRSGGAHRSRPCSTIPSCGPAATSRRGPAGKTISGR